MGVEVARSSFLHRSCVADGICSAAVLLKVRPNELIQQGVKDRIFNSIQADTEWSFYALEVLEKKTNGKKPEEMKEILKLKKFLNYRGFEFEDIDKAFSMLNKENL